MTKNNLTEEIKRALFIYRGIANSLRNNNFDIIHFNTSCSKAGIVRDLIYIRKLKGKARKIVLHFHCDTSYQVKGAIEESLFKKFCGYADVILCLNRASQEHIKDIASKNSTIIPNFIDLNNMPIDSERKFADHIRSVIYVGHVIGTKGCGDIIAVAREMPQITFKMVGFLSEEFKEISSVSNIKFTGEVSKQRVVEEMKDSDVFFLPSHTEGFPISILEAMACGLPVIATPVGAIPDIIENKGGILVNVGDVNGMVRAVEELQDIGKRREMSEWNRSRVLNCYTVNIVLDKILKVYRR